MKLSTDLFPVSESRIFAPVIINFACTGLAAFYILYFGQFAPDISLLDFIIELLSSLTSFVLFLATGFLMPLGRTRKILLVGLLAIQLGRMADAFDEIILFDFALWSVVGDSSTLCGEILVAIAAIRWVIISDTKANTDPLTGLFNRRYHERAIRKSLNDKGALDENGVALIALDLDDFKAINDQYGHALGDLVLRHTAEILQNCSRDGDIVSRVGGEEFEILLPVGSSLQAAAIAERMRHALEVNPPGSLSKATASFGVATARSGDTLDSLRARADEALYLSKSFGKNSITTA